MGEPATPTPADRLATRKLAADIVQSVIEDGPMPLGMQYYNIRDHGLCVKQNDAARLAFQLAQEVTLLRADLDEALQIAWRRGRGDFPPEDSDRLAALGRAP